MPLPDLSERTVAMKNPSTMARFRKDYLSKWRLYAFLLIPLIYIIIFAYVPMVGAQIAFRDYDFTLGIWGSEWVGWKNFERFFRYHDFWKILWNTLSVSLYSLIAGFPLPIILALILHSFPGKRYTKVVQTVMYMPHFISVVVMVGMIMQMFNPLSGVFGLAYQSITGDMMPDIFANPNAFSHIYVWSGIWQGLGWNSIIYMAALSGVDMQLHESAQIDGATRLQRVLHIDLPAVLPTACILLIMNAGGIMNVGFEKVLLLQNDLNRSRSEVISTYVYKVGLMSGGDFSYATAVGLFNSVVNFALLIIVNFVSKRLGETSLW